MNKPTHIAIHVDDIDRASDFYRKVFNWSFQSYGPSDFKQIMVSDGDQQSLIGALQDRKYSPVSEPIVGVECSIEVEDVEKVAQAVQDAGGVILMPKTEIPHVGWVIKFRDTEGSLLCAIQYHKRG